MVRTGIYFLFSVTELGQTTKGYIYIVSWHPRILSTKQSHNVSPLESYWANTNYTLIQQFSAYEANWSGGGGARLIRNQDKQPPPPPQKEEKSCSPILLECYLFFADLNEMIDLFIKYDYVYLCEKKVGGGLGGTNPPSSPRTSVLTPTCMQSSYQNKHGQGIHDTCIYLL